MWSKAVKMWSYGIRPSARLNGVLPQNLTERNSRYLVSFQKTCKIRMNMVDHSTANYHAQTPKLELPTRTARHLATQTEGWYKMPPPKTGFAIIT